MIPKNGLQLIKEFEGFASKAYADPLHGWEVATIGYGTTVYPDTRQKVKKGDTISEGRATQYLINYLQKFVIPALAEDVPYWDEMNSDMRGALMSFAYNLGHHFYGSQGFETISSLLHNKEWRRVPDAFIMYRNPGTNVEEGLRRRRKAEGDLWMKGMKANLSSDSIKDEYLLICPPENWKAPIEVSGNEVDLLTMVSDRLGLELNIREDQGKAYLGRGPESSPKADPSKPAEPSLAYPNGTSYPIVSNYDNKYRSARSTASPLINAPPNAKLGKYFKARDFMPKDEQYEFLRIHPKLLAKLDAIREQTGPLNVSSGYRPPEYNSAIGGVSNSFHIDGFAADVWASDVSTAELYQICLNVIGDSGGVGYYPRQGFVHVDVRGYGARWTG